MEKQEVRKIDHSSRSTINFRRSLKEFVTSKQMSRKKSWLLLLVMFACSIGEHQQGPTISDIILWISSWTRDFVYLPPFIYRILALIDFYLIYFEWRDTENQQSVAPSVMMNWHQNLVRPILSSSAYLNKQFCLIIRTRTKAPLLSTHSISMIY